jgi:hypothetical protein
MTFPRTTAYRAAIHQLADAVADIAIEELASVSVRFEVADDFDRALERRHRRFANALSDAHFVEYKRQEVERRRAGARKAAITRAKAKTDAAEA